jgi:hypothetical protein
MEASSRNGQVVSRQTNGDAGGFLQHLTGLSLRECRISSMTFHEPELGKCVK